jgi:TolA-binding protein
MTLIRCLVATFLLVLAGVVSAATAEERQADLERIRVERAQAEAAYALREDECRQRFAVTSCIDEARRERRQVIDRLREQQIRIDEAQRKERAAQRLEDIRQKQSAEESQRRDASARDRLKGTRRHDVLTLVAPASGAASGPARSAVRRAGRRGAPSRRIRQAPAGGAAPSRGGRASATPSVRPRARRGRRRCRCPTRPR